MGVGVIFSDSNDVIPDVVWLSIEKYATLIDDAGHVRGAPDLVIEVLSSGAEYVNVSPIAELWLSPRTNF